MSHSKQKTQIISESINSLTEEQKRAIIQKCKKSKNHGRVSTMDLKGIHTCDYCGQLME